MRTSVSQTSPICHYFQEDFVVLVLKCNIFSVQLRAVVVMLMLIEQLFPFICTVVLWARAVLVFGGL